jgi:two-component system, OmpR family, phosphate regulon sensor histidine kinase PhoR
MSGERILVVDDSRQIVTHLAEQVLPTFGFKTLYALDGRAGFQMIRTEKPDLIMLDLNLPEMTGIDVLQMMVEESINIPVVLMTGYGSEKSAIDAFRLGAKDYIIKPFSVDEVLETINRALMETRLRQDKQQLAEQLRRAHVEMRRRVNEMSTLFGIGKAVTSLLSVKKILDRVLEAAMYLSSAEESNIWFLDRESNDLKAYAKKGSGATQPDVQQLALKDTQIGQVMSSGRPFRDSSFSGKGITVKTGYSARAVLYVPLMLRGEAIGVLGVTNRTEPRTFSERDEFLLSALADYAAIALENARVFQATDSALASGNDELRTLIQITRTLTASLDLDEVVRMTIKQVHDSWQIEASSLWLLDEESQTLRVLANVGTPAETLNRFRVPVGQGFVGHVAQTGGWVFTNAVDEHPLHFREIDQETGFKTHSLLCVPLIFRDQVIGAMQLLNKLDGPFDDRDVERAQSIANAVAIGVTNSRLFEAAESRQQQLSATLEHNGNPIIITDSEDRIVLLNQKARVRLDLTVSAIGQSVTQIVRPAELANFLVRPLDRGSAQQAEIMLADGSTWLCKLAPIPSYGRVLILQDISYLKELERGKSEFIATISHDLRAPLSSVIGFAQAVGEAGPLNEDQQLYLERIKRSSNRMMEMVNGLLKLGQVTAGLDEGRQSCNLVELAREAILDWQAEAGTKEIDLSLAFSNETFMVNGNDMLLRQAIGNLIDNAIKYSTAGQEVKVQISSSDGMAQLTVTDQGAGIAASDLPNLFEKFYRAKNDRDVDGIGLGLTLVRSIAEAHGGKAWAESQPGTGSVFSIILPLVEAGQLSTAAAAGEF